MEELLKRITNELSNAQRKANHDVDLLKNELKEMNEQVCPLLSNNSQYLHNGATSQIRDTRRSSEKISSFESIIDEIKLEIKCQTTAMDHIKQKENNFLSLVEANRQQLRKFATDLATTYATLKRNPLYFLQ